MSEESVRCTACRYSPGYCSLCVLRSGPPTRRLPRQKTGPSEELEKQFATEMSGATLVGHYSLGKQPAGKEERYELSEVTKIEGDRWLFKSRIVYGNHDVTVPMYLEVKWAGDTPVITLTDLAIPGLGTYTARVLIYRGQYAGHLEWRRSRQRTLRPHGREGRPTPKATRNRIPSREWRRGCGRAESRIVDRLLDGNSDRETILGLIAPAGRHRLNSIAGGSVMKFTIDIPDTMQKSLEARLGRIWPRPPRKLWPSPGTRPRR